MSFDNTVLDTFLEKQLQLFPETVAETREEADDFLEMMMAAVCRNKKEVREYFEEAGSDISGLSMDELLEESEVFALPDGRYLVVEG